jgi:hypothetical protein
MKQEERLRYLRIALVVFGAIFIAGIYITMIQAIVDETERANLFGDVPALFLVAFVLWYLMPAASEALPLRAEPKA